MGAQAPGGISPEPEDLEPRREQAQREYSAPPWIPRRRVFSRCLFPAAVI